MADGKLPGYANASWYKALAEEVKRSSQARAARRLQISSSTVSQLLKGNYPSNIQHMVNRIEGELLHKTVKCPVLGEISTRQCQREQDRPFAPTNPHRIAVYKACRGGCPHSKHGRST